MNDSSLSRLNDFALRNNILTKHQYGFTPNKGITDALFDLLGSVRLSLLDKKYCLLVFCDFSKAFDTLDHDRLLLKLSKNGIRGVPLNLIKSYLSGRTQMVSLNNVLSDSLSITHGAPQGSILAPLLFNIYVNDLFYYLGEPHPIQYADDTTLVDVYCNVDVLFSRMQSTINRFYEWYVANYLSLNASKTKFILFSKDKFTGLLYPLTVGDSIFL